MPTQRTWSSLSSKPRQRISCFNMIEVAIALAVIAVGVVSIMALFPIGLAASRDAMAESYASEMADMLLHYNATLLKRNWDVTISQYIADDAAAAQAAESNLSGQTAFEFPAAGSHTWFTPSSSPGALKIERRTGQVTDASIIFHLWKQQPQYTYYDGSAWQTSNINGESGLCLEATWPAALPLTRRQRAMYYLEVVKP